MNRLLSKLIVDESLFMKRKYHRGDHTENRWVFGGVERGSAGNLISSGFRVSCREMGHFAASDRTVDFARQPHSFRWLGHPPGDAQFRGRVYSREEIIHNDNFVNPNDSEVHTQTVESTCDGLR